jgi:hypothetical protein
MEKLRSKRWKNEKLRSEDITETGWRDESPLRLL